MRYDPEEKPGVSNYSIQSTLSGRASSDRAQLRGQGLRRVQGRGGRLLVERSRPSRRATTKSSPTRLPRGGMTPSAGAPLGWRPHDGQVRKKVGLAPCSLCVGGGLLLTGTNNTRAGRVSRAGRVTRWGRTSEARTHPSRRLGTWRRAKDAGPPTSTCAAGGSGEAPSSFKPAGLFLPPRGPLACMQMLPDSEERRGRPPISR